MLILNQIKKRLKYLGLFLLINNHNFNSMEEIYYNPSENEESEESENDLNENEEYANNYDKNWFEDSNNQHISNKPYEEYENEESENEEYEESENEEYEESENEEYEESENEEYEESENDLNENEIEPNITNLINKIKNNKLLNDKDIKKIKQLLRSKKSKNHSNQEKLKLIKLRNVYYHNYYIKHNITLEDFKKILTQQILNIIKIYENIQKQDITTIYKTIHENINIEKTKKNVIKIITSFYKKYKKKICDPNPNNQNELNNFLPIISNNKVENVKNFLEILQKIDRIYRISIYLFNKLNTLINNNKDFFEYFKNSEKIKNMRKILDKSDKEETIIQINEYICNLIQHESKFYKYKLQYMEEFFKQHKIELNEIRKLYNKKEIKKKLTILKLQKIITDNELLLTNNDLTEKINEINSIKKTNEKQKKQIDLINFLKEPQNQAKNKLANKLYRLKCYLGYENFFKALDEFGISHQYKENLTLLFNIIRFKHNNKSIQINNSNHDIILEIKQQIDNQNELPKKEENNTTIKEISIINKLTTKTEEYLNSIEYQDIIRFKQILNELYLKHKSLKDIPQKDTEKRSELKKQIIDIFELDKTFQEIFKNIFKDTHNNITKQKLIKYNTNISIPIYDEKGNIILTFDANTIILIIFLRRFITNIYHTNKINESTKEKKSTKETCTTNKKERKLNKQFEKSKSQEEEFTKKTTNKKERKEEKKLNNQFENSASKQELYNKDKEYFNEPKLRKKKTYNLPKTNTKSNVASSNILNNTIKI